MNKKIENLVIKANDEYVKVVTDAMSLNKIIVKEVYGSKKLDKIRARSIVESLSDTTDCIMEVIDNTRKVKKIIIDDSIKHFGYRNLSENERRIIDEFDTRINAMYELQNNISDVERTLRLGYNIKR